MSSEDPGFRVVDRRTSSGKVEEQPKTDSQTKQGPGFSMKDSKEVPPGVEPMKLDFSGIVLSFATSVLVYLGETPEPMTGKISKAEPDLARQNIDILEILHEKTKGNLTQEEATLIERVLSDVRLAFVRSVKGPKQ